MNIRNWEAREQNSTYFNRTWCDEIIYVDESEVLQTVRCFDFAGTLVSDLVRSPDYTATCRMRKMKNGDYVIDDVRRIRIRHGDWFNFVIKCSQDDPPSTVYYIPEDPNPSAKRASMLFARELAEAGLYVKRIKTNKSKLDRFRPFSSMAQNSGVKFLANCGIDYENGITNDLKFVYAELENFTGQRKRGEAGHDDLVDAISDCYLTLASGSTSLSGINKGLNDMNKQMVTGNPFK